MKDPCQLKSKAEGFYVVTHRSISIPLQKAVIAGLKGMEVNKIISWVTQPSQWCSVVMKRQCQNLCGLRKALSKYMQQISYAPCSQ